MKLITTMFCLAMVCLCVGCAKDTSAPPDKAPAKPADPVREAIGFMPEVAACSDGTIYVLSEKVVWLVNDKAVVIPIDEDPTVGSLMGFKPISAFNGGVYVVGANRLWYLKSGVAKPVAPVSVSAISPDEHKVTAQSVNWAALTTYGREQFDKGLEAGREAALSDAAAFYDDRGP